MGKKTAAEVEVCFSCGAKAERHKWIGRGSATLGLSKRLEAGDDPKAVAADLAAAGSRMENYPICDECHQQPKPRLKLHYYPAGADSAPSQDGSLGMPAVPKTSKA